MTREFRRQFLFILGFIIILGIVVSNHSDTHDLFQDLLSELPFAGQMIGLAAKITDTASHIEVKVRSVWDDIIRSIFVALVAMPCQSILGRIFGFRYRGDEVYETPLSFGNQIRDFIYAGIAIVFASALFVLVRETDILAQIFPDIPEIFRFIFLCVILAVVDCLFFCYYMYSARLGLFFGFLVQTITLVFEEQFIIFLMCLLIVSVQNIELIGGVITVIVMLIGLTFILGAGSKK